MKNKLCEIIGCQYPIIQGAMQWVSDASLVSAVSNAGGFGVLASADAQAEDIRKEIQQIKALTNKPFAVNIALISKTAEDVFKVVLEEGVPFVALTAGNPKPYIPYLIEAGIPFFGVVATVKQAAKMEEAGASFVVVEGMEAGGHIGEMTSMSFIPQARDVLSIPLVAAGGISDGRGMAAAFALGADGIQMGSRFLLANECNVHENFKAKLLQASSSDSVVTGRLSNHAVRCIANDLTKAYQEQEQSKSSELVSLGKGAAYRAAVEGDMETGSIMAGQSLDLLTKESSAKEIIEETINQYNEVIASLSKIEL